MKLSRTVVYALHAILQLAQAKGESPVPCSRLAAKGGMPERFLLQVLRSLVTHGILSSTRGVDGGYRLAQSADEISLLDVIEAIDGPLYPLSPDINGLPPRVPGEVTMRVHRHHWSFPGGKLQAIKLADLLPEADGQDAATPN